VPLDFIIAVLVSVVWLGETDKLVFKEWLVTTSGCVRTTDDIAVRFYEQDDEGNVRWEDYGNFANHDVHRQVMVCNCFNFKFGSEWLFNVVHNPLMPGLEHNCLCVRWGL